MCVDDAGHIGVVVFLYRVTCRAQVSTHDGSLLVVVSHEQNRHVG